MSSETAQSPGSILILTGPPGAGKTTVAHLLAEAAEGKTVHLHTDDFFSAIHKGFVAPWLTESSDQNATISKAIIASAAAFARGGYAVIVDGVVGPWFLDIYRDEARRLGLALDYVVLRPGRADAVRRARGRAVSPLPDYPPHIFEGFADLEALEGHALPISEEDAEAVASSVRRGLALGRFRLVL